MLSWVKDLISALRERSGERESLFILDCNPSFAIYTQLALVASDYVVVPFTADDSSRRAIENVVALLYGVADDPLTASQYARISFAKRALEEGLTSPKLHTFISNRVTLYEGRPSKAFEVSSQRIKKTVSANPYRAPKHICCSKPEADEEFHRDPRLSQRMYRRRHYRHPFAQIKTGATTTRQRKNSNQPWSTQNVQRSFMAKLVDAL